MAQNPLGPPPFIAQETAFDRWMGLLYQRVYTAFVGDSGTGGAMGLVPAPAAGDAAAGKYLKADGTWTAVSGSGDGTTNNVISTPTTISTDKSYLVVGYLTIESTFTNNGNVGIF